MTHFSPLAQHFEEPAVLQQVLPAGQHFAKSP
jgi:hypothetical protein